MANDNIDERPAEIMRKRRAEITQLLDSGVEIDRKTQLFLAEKYGCSESAIADDIKLLRQLRG